MLLCNPNTIIVIATIATVVTVTSIVIVALLMSTLNSKECSIKKNHQHWSNTLCRNNHSDNRFHHHTGHSCKADHHPWPHCGKDR